MGDDPCAIIVYRHTAWSITLTPRIKKTTDHCNKRLCIDRSLSLSVANRTNARLGSYVL